MKNACAVAALIVIVQGCAFQVFDQKLRPFVGQPVANMFSKLGIPTSEQMIAGQRVYVWQTSGLVDGTDYRCRIRAIVDGAQVIRTVDYEGNEGGCQHYAAALR